MTSNTSTLPPSQHALLLPEILRNIIMWIVADENGAFTYNEETKETTHHSRDYIIFCCALVNKFWYAETIFHLWNDTTISDISSIGDCLKSISDPARRQYYANFVEKANIWSFGWESPSDKALHGLEFPNLRYLNLIIPFGGDEIPQIKADGVVELKINPQHEPYPHEWIGEEIMGEVLDRIPTLFPFLRVVSFLDYADVNQEDLQRLKERLPGLIVSPIPNK